MDDRDDRAHASPAAVRPSSATRWRSCVAEAPVDRLATTPRSGSVVRRAPGCGPPPRTTLVDAVRRADEAGEPGARARRRQQPRRRRRRASTAPSSRSRRPASGPTPRTTTPPAAASWSRVGGGRELGRVRRDRGRARLGRRRGARPASRARSVPPRSRTSAPTARRSRRRSPGPRLGPRGCAACAPSPPPTAASATAPAASRPTPVAPRRPRRHLPAPPGRARRAGARTPSWPAPSASSWARGRRWPTYAVPCSGCARGKGMVLDPADHDTWSAGSFFTNPVLDARRRARRAPRRGRSRTAR